MAATTNKNGSRITLPRKVLEELILSSSRLNNAIASVIEGSLVDAPMTAAAIQLAQLEELEDKGERESEEPAPTDEELKVKAEQDRKARESRTRDTKKRKDAKAKKEKELAEAVVTESEEAARQESEQKEEPSAETEEQSDGVQAEKSEDKTEVVEEKPLMSEEDAMAELKSSGMQLFKADKEAFQSILKSFDVKSFPQLDYDGKLKALGMIEKALSEVAK